MRVKDFVNKYYDYAKENEVKTGVPALITLAQAALESGWGKFAPGNNFFGIKDSDSVNYGAQVLTTSEYENGEKITVRDGFETYPSAKECFEHHAILLRNQFPKAFSYKDPQIFIMSVQNDHYWSNGKPKKYATDPNYVSKIISICEMIKDVLPKPIQLNERETLKESDIPDPKPLENIK